MEVCALFHEPLLRNVLVSRTPRSAYGGARQSRDPQASSTMMGPGAAAHRFTLCCVRGTKTRSRHARCVQGLRQMVPQRNRGRRECRVLQPTPTASRANGKSTRAVVTTGKGRITGIPCAMVLRFPSCSPRRPGFVASVVGAMQSIVANLTPALVCQDHTTSPYAAAHSSRAPPASIASRFLRS